MTYLAPVCNSKDSIVGVCPRVFPVFDDPAAEHGTKGGGEQGTRVYSVHPDLLDGPGERVVSVDGGVVVEKKRHAVQGGYHLLHVSTVTPKKGSCPGDAVLLFGESGDVHLDVLDELVGELLVGQVLPVQQPLNLQQK